MKVTMFGSMVPRPVSDLVDRGSDAVDEVVWLDVLGLDSLYDYDTVWQRCIELGVAPSFHASGRGRGFGLRASPSNFVYNHIGHFAAANEAVAKALFMGGVTRRFPDLKFSFLEGGVGWACQLLSDLVEHWEVRNSNALDALKPANVDFALLDELAGRYGSDAMKRSVSRHLTRPTNPAEGLVAGRSAPDDFAACEINEAQHIADLFVTPYWFGCEAEDRLAAWAFKSEHNAFGARLNATLGSDIGHFDVTDMASVIAEAHELVDDGLMSEADFRDYSFANTVRLLGGMSPAFFEGTAVEAEAAAVLSS